MRNEDNDCIRYLMKEMDPSEELLMERAMMEDEDLLIEVESMRQTLQKLDDMPEKNPPSHVTDAIMEKAAEQAEKNRKNNKSFSPTFKYAIAATIALTITAGGAWLFVQPNNGDHTQATTSATVTSQPQGQEQSATPALEFSSDDIQQASVSQSTVEPWVDRNDIIRFEDQFSNQNQNFEAILKSSTQKLQLIDNPVNTNGRVNPIQLTGSHR